MADDLISNCLGVIRLLKRLIEATNIKIKIVIYLIGLKANSVKINAMQ